MGIVDLRAVLAPNDGSRMGDSMPDEQDHGHLARDLRDALAVVVRAFHVIAPQMQDPGAHSEIMIKAIDLIAVISRIEERLPAGSGDSHPEQGNLLARDTLEALNAIGKALLVISRNTKDIDASSAIMNKTIDLAGVIMRMERRLKT